MSEALRPDLTPWARRAIRYPFGVVIGAGIMCFATPFLAYALGVQAADPQKANFLFAMGGWFLGCGALALGFQLRQGRRDLDALLRWPLLSAEVVKLYPVSQYGPSARKGATWTLEGPVENRFLALRVRYVDPQGSPQEADLKGRGPPEYDQVGAPVMVYVNPEDPSQVVCLELGERALTPGPDGVLGLSDPLWMGSLAVFGSVGLVSLAVAVAELGGVPLL